MTDLATIRRIYEGSDGDATKGLYARLEPIGPVGVIALNLFRACKCSERAKVYRGRRYKNDAYARKQWSMDNLCQVLAADAARMITPPIAWGWGEDAAQAKHRWVLYVEIMTGQVSFHTEDRGVGPDYPGRWDGAKGQSAERICLWIAQLLDTEQRIRDIQERPTGQGDFLEPGGVSMIVAGGRGRWD